MKEFFAKMTINFYEGYHDVNTNEQIEEILNGNREFYVKVTEEEGGNLSFKYIYLNNIIEGDIFSMRQYKVSSDEQLVIDPETEEIKKRVYRETIIKLSKISDQTMLMILNNERQEYFPNLKENETLKK